MATLTSSKVASSVPAKETNQHLIHVAATYELTAALALDDVIQMVKVPKGAVIVELVLATDDLDSNGAPAIVLDVGDGADTDRFIDGYTGAQANGNISRLGAGMAASKFADALGYTYTADDTIDIHVQVAPATGTATGTIVLVVIYSCDP